VPGRRTPLARREVGGHAVRAVDDREEVRQFDLEPRGDSSQGLPEVADHVRAEPLLPPGFDLAEELRPDRRRRRAGRRPPDDPLAPQVTGASPTITLRLRRLPRAGGADEHVSPPLHAAERREQPPLR
jgi:hypothetical protein